MSRHEINRASLAIILRSSMSKKDYRSLGDNLLLVLVVALMVVASVSYLGL